MQLCRVAQLLATLATTLRRQVNRPAAPLRSTGARWSTNQIKSARAHTHNCTFSSINRFQLTGWSAGRSAERRVRSAKLGSSAEESQSKPKQAKASQSKPKQAKASCKINVNVSPAGGFARPLCCATLCGRKLNGSLGLQRAPDEKIAAAWSSIIALGCVALRCAVCAKQAQRSP